MSQALPAEALERPRDARAIARALVELSKPGVTRLVLVTTALGVIAAPRSFEWVDLIVTTLGTGLVVAGANALNMFLERDSDRFMSRTRTRPLPSGRLAPDAALSFGVFSSVLGLCILAQFVSMAAVALAAVALLSYVLVYTPLKRVSSAALYVGAIPGALPPAIGYAALTGTVDGLGLWLFLILLIWQVPHFLAISIFRRDEYERAGLRVLPNERGLMWTKSVALAFAGVLGMISLLPFFLGLAPAVYGWVAALSGAGFFVLVLKGLFPASDKVWARTVFFASMPHLVLVMGALVAST